MTRKLALGPILAAVVALAAASAVDLRPGLARAAGSASCDPASSFPPPPAAEAPPPAGATPAEGEGSAGQATTPSPAPGEPAAGDQSAPGPAGPASSPPDATTDTTPAPPAPPGESTCPSGSGPSTAIPQTRSPDNPAAQPKPSKRPSADKAKKKEKKKPGTQDSTGPDGAPAIPGSAFSFSAVGPLQAGVPDSVLGSFGIPPFLLPIYQAAGTQYGVPWEVLAAINQVETDYGRNLGASSAGALGWMQFLASSWRTYGVDGNGDGEKDPYNPVDAIFAAARYLRAAGADRDLRQAVYAYNHAGWYVDSVMAQADQIRQLPPGLVAALTGLAQGRFPVTGHVSYAGAVGHGPGRGLAATAATAGAPSRGAIDIRAGAGASAVAVNDGVVARVGSSDALGRFVELRDVYGNLYTYSHLGEVAASYPAPRTVAPSRAALRGEAELPARGPKPSGPAAPAQLKRSGRPKGGYLAAARSQPKPPAPPIDRGGLVERRLVDGAQVTAGTVLGRVGASGRLGFAVRPAGEGAPAIDGRPILDGWKLLGSAGVYPGAGKGLLSDDAAGGQALLLGKQALGQRVLADTRIHVYGCGRSDIAGGIVDRRVLATLEFLASSGLSPTVTSLRCGHSYLTAGGSVSEHSSGDAVDIAAVNGVPILGHQGPGSITEETIRRLLTLQGAMRPHQIISLMTFQGADNTLSLPDHANHIHVGFRPLAGAGAPAGAEAVLQPGQWATLTDRLNQLYAPGSGSRGSRLSSAPAGNLDGGQPTGAPAPAPAVRIASPLRPAPVAQARDLQLRVALAAQQRHLGKGGGPLAGRLSRRLPPERPDAEGQAARPSLKAKPSVVEVGGRLVLKGRGWTCPDGQAAARVTVAAGKGSLVLADARPDPDGKFRQGLDFAKSLLGARQLPAALHLSGEAKCPGGEQLSTGDRTAPLLVVEKLPSGGGSGDGGHQGDSQGSSSGGKHGESAVDGVTASSPGTSRSGRGASGDQPAPSSGIAGETVAGGGGGDGSGSSAAGDSSGGKTKKHHHHGNKGDSGGATSGDGNGGGGGNGDGKNKGSGGGGKGSGAGKGGRLVVPAKAPRLLSAAQAARSPKLGGVESFSFPRPASPYLVVGILALLALALALSAEVVRRRRVSADAFAGDAPTQPLEV